MIYGIGTDIVNIDRINNILKKNKDRLINKILTEQERLIFANRSFTPSYCAKRFAAKEAFAKALGVGIGGSVSFQDLTVKNDEQGKPYFIVSEKLRIYLINKKIKQAFLSISDENNHAVAFVILEKDI